MTDERYACGELLSSDNPFWFASEELLTDVLRDEIRLVNELFARHPDLPEFFDLPEATVPQRKACFTVLVHSYLMGEIYETFAGRYIQPLSLGDEEKEALRRTQRLVASDAPAWALEVDQVAELLPSRVYGALPEPLYKGGYGYDSNNQTEVDTIRAAAKTLSSVEQLQVLIGTVVDEQLQRLEARWAVSTIQVSGQMESRGSKRQLTGTQGLGPKKIDLSRWLDGLTEKQHLAFSLKQEYGLGLAEIAARMGVDRKTAYEHINAAATRIDQIRSGESRKANRAKSMPEE